ncbi:hypothetical protein QVD17_40544 [Tagetes erecta]|uniref:non-specific serine/threonine protein kinase n=1 Tax=Tagetes erecta TaxID=13708 RepID=A0AAD8NHW1_TARER|nr:hypothetical protein QVD17_40544 [Tagetes erecta]
MDSKQPIIRLSFPSLFSLYHFQFYSFVIFMTFTIISASYAGNETDHHALQMIKLITQDPYGALTSWNNSLHFCDWAGVTCGKRHRRVTRLVLESQGLKGMLSPYVGNLSFLHELRLVNNSFQGIIPHELGRLSRLRILRLVKNKFNGLIPANISGCSNLQDLRLSYNELVGTIPIEISFLSKLAIVSLRSNSLTGGIPSCLGNITSMKAFYVAENPFGGSIPETIGNWKYLNDLILYACNLSGIIPHSLYNLSLLTSFSVSDNQLSGSLPPAIMFSHIELFQLTNNQLTGPFPPSISNCTRLSILEIIGNKFSGKLTTDFSKLSDILYIRLGDNLFGSKEADEMKFIDSLKNCTRLIELDIGQCEFQGVLPTSIGNLSSQLQYLALGINHFHGDIPRSIGNLVGLLLMILGANQFTGNIPSTLGKLQKLESLDLSENGLSGTIPDSIGNLSKLFHLSLGSNNLEGQIPSSLGELHRLLELFLNENNLTGKIPSHIFQLSSLSKTLDLSDNYLFGSLPTEVGDLKMLGALDLSYNNLSGNITSSLGGCASLSSLYLNSNNFQGTIPPTLSSLKGLIELDVSQNNLSGKVPQFLEGISLEYLNLSYNDFEGEVPSVKVFANISAFSVLGNSRLCGGIVELGLPKCKETNKHKMKFPLFVIVIMIASIFVMITCLAYAWCKKKRKNQLSQSSTSKRFMKVTYGQLLKATAGFSEANLIGNGGFSSVYKGTLHEDEEIIVAVKVLHLQNRGAQKSFLRECEAWRNIRHRNLLRIITSCSSVDFQGNDFKALVYEFMSNGSLDYWLHSSDIISRPTLNLLQIVNILTDVAYALDYLHNHCMPTVVHGDLKPSNILLDDDMMAHVGDFGLAKILGTSYPNSSTGIGGTIGYVAPEYGLGCEMTSSADVYSFGILLLEAITGKKPIDSMFNEGLSLHKFASMALPDHVTDVIDRNTLNVYQGMSGYNTEANAKKIEECLVSIVKIGVSCSMDSPAQRMDMGKVVHELRPILDTLQHIEV